MLKKSKSFVMVFIAVKKLLICRKYWGKKIQKSLFLFLKRPKKAGGQKSVYSSWSKITKNTKKYKNSENHTI